MTKTNATATRIKPIPEMLSADRWVVREGGGSVSIAPEKDGNREMRVPLSATDHGSAVRKHEYCHIVFSPPEIAAHAHRETIQAVEDYRVNRLGTDAGLEWGRGFDARIIETGIAAAGAMGDLKRVLLSVMAASSVSPSRKVAKAAAKEFLTGVHWDILDHAMYLVDDQPERFQGTVEAADYIDAAFQKLEDEADEDAKAQEGERNVQRQPAGTGTGEAANDSGKMTIVSPSLVGTLRGRDGRRVRTSDSGTQMIRPSRYITDKRIFKSSKKTLGGVILIDVSGSMGLSEVDIVNLLNTRPAACIATYSGTRDIGELVIIAKNGRVTDKKWIYKSMGGNVVDYPALVWLAKQKGPRYWICDGNVTGNHDRSYTSVTKACARVQRAGGIKRFSGVRSFLENVVDTDSLY